MSEPQEQNAASPEDAGVPASATPAGAAPEAGAGQGRKRSRRGGRGRGRQPGATTEPVAAATASPAQAPRAARSQHPLLVQLAEWHPQLFGEQPLPLKRGIFEDLLGAHPEGLDREQLKLALAQHTRSSRYLTVVASGQARHDLQGQSVEAMAPEHVHHALIEVFRRRQQRSAEDLAPKLRNRIIAAYEASGLSRDDYAARVQGRDQATNALVADALAEADARAARDEALLRAFEASGQASEAGFADMYGMNPRQVAQQLERARRRLQAA
ncbi:MAG: ProQ/FinO family protein [Burkholderiaceae bacterium]|nr:ProQ/FinO family protein [Burkholderiaceae bacterium]